MNENLIQRFSNYTNKCNQCETDFYSEPQNPSVQNLFNIYKMVKIIVRSIVNDKKS